MRGIGGLVRWDAEAQGEGEPSIYADARIDNRRELVDSLGGKARDGASDADLILQAYRRWGEGFPAELLGDFAFALWDPARSTLFCARDPLGVRPFCYYHRPGQLFAFASDPHTLLRIPGVPFQLHQPRIADLLVPRLEGVDRTSTFYEGVQRLPPGHLLKVTPEGISLRAFWTPEPQTELHLSSDQEYVEAFREVYGEAVRCRLDDSTGAMLSGGIDSGSAMGWGRHLRIQEGKGPLATFSAIRSDSQGCAETRTIQGVTEIDGLEPHTVSEAELSELLPELADLTWGVTNPFDAHMTLDRVMYMKARQAGMTALLDGIDGDLVLSEGRGLARMLRRGRWRAAAREVRGKRTFWGEGYPATRTLLRAAGQALVPQPVLKARRPFLARRREGRRVQEVLSDSLMDPAFAQRMGLEDRLRTLESHSVATPLGEPQWERVRALDHPYLTVALERYHRVAAQAGLEARHPLLDLRVVRFCLSLPDHQRTVGGWPKVLLRRATEGYLPDEFRWRRGKVNLGGTFNRALFVLLKENFRVAIQENMALLSEYIDAASLRLACASVFQEGHSSWLPQVQDVACLGMWLGRHEDRPPTEGWAQGPGSRFTAI